MIPVKMEFSFGRYMDEENSKYEKDASPGVEFTDVPEDAESIALIMDDPEALRPGAFTHWLIWNIPPGHDLKPDIPSEKKLPFGAVQGSNDFNEIGYGGPKSPRGEWKNYRFRAYALDTELDLPPGTRQGTLERAIVGHVIDRCEARAPYKRDFDEPVTTIEGV